MKCVGIFHILDNIIFFFYERLYDILCLMLSFQVFDEIISLQFFYMMHSVFGVRQRSPKLISEESFAM